jgi:hypothetical protein
MVRTRLKLIKQDKLFFLEPNQGKSDSLLVSPTDFSYSMDLPLFPLDRRRLLCLGNVRKQENKFNFEYYNNHG